jgi:heme/copper-type cytochrome/quinol oxidase subunit 2
MCLFVVILFVRVVELVFLVVGIVVYVCMKTRRKRRRKSSEILKYFIYTFLVHAFPSICPLKSKREEGEGKL